jgi:sphingomyelin phosphodiesterase acid-like 3
MKHSSPSRFPHVNAWQLGTILCFYLIVGAACAQSAKPAQTTIPVLLLSDIHFEPFWDPAKVAQLDAQPVTQWNAILAPPVSSDQPQRFAALQQACPAKGLDTDYTLYQSSLKAVRAHSSGAAFAVVSGDLISHQYRCKYFTFFPQAQKGQYEAFVQKTLDYVMGELEAALPKTVVYVALGNNDSGCDDYRLDANSSFLKEVGAEVTKKFPASERLTAQQTFAAGGYYSIALPAPIQNARLLVLDDLFMSKNYKTCANQPDPKAAAPQMAWLAKQLADARTNKQKVWVMGHIPPGVDLYSSAKRLSGICNGTQKPAMFLSSEEMADVIAGYGDVVELAIFAHTHMNELRLLKDSTSSQPPVPVKMVSSISPIHGNHPSFTLAQVDPATMALVDFQVIASANLSGDPADWKQEYDFGKSFALPDFSSSSVAKLIDAFAADPDASTQASRNYIGDFSADNSSSLLQMFWPQYVCTLGNRTAQSFTACLCSAAH